MVNIHLKKEKMRVVSILLVCIFVFVGCITPSRKEFPKNSPKPRVIKSQATNKTDTYIIGNFIDQNSNPMFGILFVDFFDKEKKVKLDSSITNFHFVDQTGLYTSNSKGKVILKMNKFGRIKLNGTIIGYLNSKPKKLNIQKGDSLIVNIKMIEDLRPIVDPVIKGR